MAGMSELTAEEKAKPYSEHCCRSYAGVSPELASQPADDEPMDPEEALPIERMNGLLGPGSPRRFPPAFSRGILA